jgi:hypothetical protein
LRLERVVGAGRKINHGLERPEGLNSPPGQFKAAALICMMMQPQQHHIFIQITGIISRKKISERHSRPNKLKIVVIFLKIN